MKALALCAALALAGFGGVVQAAEQQQSSNQSDSQGGYSGPDKLLITVTSDDTHTQGMSMILAMQAVKRGQQVRVLFCGDGTEMAVGRYRGASLEPVGANPQQIMKKLINEHDVQMEVCGVFLPNTRYGKENLIEGVGVASPSEIGEYMADPKVRFFNH
jgi:predicted peroxiredoxin